ncbi:MAG: NAD(P)H-dependent oxidoreductase [Kofleriaceae bacterium]
MSKPLSILGLAGSLRARSFNRAALRAAQELAPADVTITTFDLDGLPGYNDDLEASPQAQVVALRDAIRAADAILIASPEYNYSIPGVLKNALDWGSRPAGKSAWRGKPCALFGASMGRLGTARMQYHLRQVLVALDMHALNRPEVMIAGAGDKFDDDLRLTDEPTRKLVGELVSGLASWTRTLAA